MDLSSLTGKNAAGAGGATSAERKEAIKQQLSSDGTQKALTAFGKDYAARYKDKTDCRKGYLVSDCKNGPKAAATTQQGTPTQTQSTQTTTQP